jgi:hypothetical protein
LGRTRTRLARFFQRRRQGALPVWNGQYPDLYNGGGDRCAKSRCNRADKTRHALCEHRRWLVAAGYRYETLLQRTGGDYEIDLPVTTTPIGAVSRLEHALGCFEQERENHRNRLADAKRRLASYTPRLGESFSFEAEFELKLSHLDKIERDLAATADEPEEERQQAA